MAKRRFKVRCDVHAELELDDAVIDVVDDEWRSVLYPLRTPQEIAEHIAFNLLQGRSLSWLDGWADQPNENAKITSSDWDIIDVEEIHEPHKQ